MCHWAAILCAAFITQIVAGVFLQGGEVGKAQCWGCARVGDGGACKHPQTAAWNCQASSCSHLLCDYFVAGIAISREGGLIVHDIPLGSFCTSGDMGRHPGVSGSGGGVAAVAGDGGGGHCSPSCGLFSQCHASTCHYTVQDIVGSRPGRERGCGIGACAREAHLVLLRPT